MAKFHMNPETGNPGKCSAAEGRCPFGSAAAHYSSAADAREVYEFKMAASTMANYDWAEGVPKNLAEAIEYERVRQHTDEARRGYLLSGWRQAKELADADEALDGENLLSLAKAIEPDNGGRLRTTPVTFANGGYASPPGTVEAGVQQLLRFWPGVQATDEDKRHWLKEFLIVHPFSDGNGRTAWVLQQWLYNTWETPEQLIHFKF